MKGFEDQMRQAADRLVEDVGNELSRILAEQAKRREDQLERMAVELKTALARLDPAPDRLERSSGALLDSLRRADTTIRRYAVSREAASGPYGRGGYYNPITYR